MKNKVYMIMGNVYYRNALNEITEFLTSKGIPELVRFTTRTVRSGEEEGREYYFHSKKHMDNMELLNKCPIPYSDDYYGFSRVALESLTHNNESFYCVGNWGDYETLEVILCGLYDIVGIYIEEDPVSLDSDTCSRMNTEYMEVNSELDSVAKKYSRYFINKANLSKIHGFLLEEWLSNKRAYVSGKMTGLDDYGRKKFSDAKLYLKSKGYEVFCPSDIGVINTWEWEDYMKYCISELSKCDVVFMLDGWEDSRGAKEEYRIAQLLKIPIDYLNDETIIINAYKDDIKNFIKSVDELKMKCDSSEIVSNLLSEISKSVKSLSRFIGDEECPDD